MSRIKGIKVVLINRIEIGKDHFGSPIYEEEEIEVDNVLVSPVSTEDIINTLELEGKRVEYIIAIPKENTNVWEDRKVRFFGKTFKVFGTAMEGIEHLIPLDWNKKYKVEIYE